MLDSGALLQKRYLIIRRIGEGGMGAVYEAKDQRLGVRVALKETIVSGESFEKAFEREARLLAKLRHPVLPVVSDYFSEADGQYLVMQYIDGKDLGQLLSERGAFPLVDVLAWADRLLDALDYLHNQQPPIIHRDIKPNNLKLTDRGEIILLDFGLAKGSTTVVQQTKSNSSSVYGYTPHYAPIEQIEGTGTDARSDLYALAATLYHLLTKVKPVDAMPRVLSVINGQEDPLRPLQELNATLPLSISDLLKKALSQKRDERPASAAIMRNALQSAIKNSNDPKILSVLAQTNRLSTSTRTNEHQPLETETLDSNSKIDTQIKTEAINLVEKKQVVTNPQPTVQETQVATQANPTVAKPKSEENRERTSKLPFVLALGSIFVLVCTLLSGVFLFQKNTKINTLIVAVDAFNASKEQNRPTKLSAKEILSKGLDEPRYYEFDADAGEIKLTLNVISNGATLEVTAFDTKLKPISLKDNTSSLTLSGLNYSNEQIDAILINPSKQKIILKISNNYPSNLKAYRIRLSGSIELATNQQNTNSTNLETLTAEFKDRDNPIPLSNNEIINPSSEKDLYYSFFAETGEIKVSLNVISNAATVSIDFFDSDSKPIKYTNGQTKLSLSATNYQNERSNLVILNGKKQKLLMRINQTYPTNLRVYRIILKGVLKLSDDKSQTKFPSLLAEFKDRDNPIVLPTNELIGKGIEKDRYYTFRTEPGEIQVNLDLIANSGTISVQFFDDKDQLIKFNDGSTSFSLTAVANHDERKVGILQNEYARSVLMRISNAYPDNIKVYRIALEGSLQIINPDPNTNKAFESLVELFENRNNPISLSSNEIIGTSLEKDSYYNFEVNETDLKLTVNLVADGAGINIELFDDNNNPIIFTNKSQSFFIDSVGNKTTEKSITAHMTRSQTIVMRASSNYPSNIKEYKIKIDGVESLTKTPSNE